MKFNTIREAAEAWVREFNAIPQGVVEKLMKLDFDDVVEITPPSKYDRVYIYDGEYDGQHGEIIGVSDEDEDVYVIQLDKDREEVEVNKDDFEVDHDYLLPMWSTMWSFGDKLDEDWLLGRYCESHLQEMADCGFRIFEQEDFGVIFGIDGCGYDFYSEHWCPLYLARGLHWHKEEDTDGATD